MMKKSVFICDDDAGITDMLTIVFELAEVEVVVENDSVRAYDVIKRMKPAVIVVDLWMPVVSGDLLIKKLRGDEELRDTYIVCMSASRDGREVATEAGADIFVAKPFDLDEIIAVVEEGFF
ncbi:response regulator [Sphingobacterium pedocola]|uniref:Response regulator n=1 Tax=Sphingobacterium pedocola TaxID=2082722 RepID=A0ABR9T224_9SPHI|nr:response regulator [Sphingobacterium pedocola]MBE8719378.1 response regulator [Sphingobacterium pedocola]